MQISRIVLLIISFVFFAMPIIAQEKMVFATIEDAMASLPSEIIIREAYRRIGINVEINKFPAKRALVMSNLGYVDGEVQRIGGVSQKYPHLIQVYPPINYIEGVVFTKKVKFQVEGWESLRSYRIGIVRGVQFVIRNTEGMNTHIVNKYEHVFNILEASRVDIIVVPRLNGLVAMKKQQIRDLSILEPAVEKFLIFHYLNEKHKKLIPRISAVFKGMAEDGTLQKIRDHVISVVLKRAERGLPVCDDDYACFEN